MSEAAAALAAVRARSGDRSPTVALVLGSGLGALADALDDPIVFAYDELPGFPRPTVKGHAGTLGLGRLGGTEVAVMKGRAHYYEAGRADGMRVPLRVLREPGCQTLVLTNAAGSLDREAGPGSLMLITDHINFSGLNPLIGDQDEVRFVDLTEAYDAALRGRMVETAARLGLPLHQGVYMWFSGPSFETPAEIRAARVLGADAVGMSTVPEAILARQAGLRVVALSTITNLAAGMEEAPLDHAQTLHFAQQAAGDLSRLLTAFLEGL
jgi:purine-nucleoside phosphorylase